MDHRDRPDEVHRAHLGEVNQDVAENETADRRAVGLRDAAAADLALLQVACRPAPRDVVVRAAVACPRVLAGVAVQPELPRGAERLEPKDEPRLARSERLRQAAALLARQVATGTYQAPRDESELSVSER